MSESFDALFNQLVNKQLSEEEVVAMIEKGETAYLEGKSGSLPPEAGESPLIQLPISKMSFWLT